MHFSLRDVVKLRCSVVAGIVNATCFHLVALLILNIVLVNAAVCGETVTSSALSVDFHGFSGHDSGIPLVDV